MKTLLILELVLVVAGSWASTSSRTRRQVRCGSGTECISLRQCPSLLSLLQNPNRNNLRKLQQATCVLDRQNPKVCCPSEVPTTTGSTAEGESLLPTSCGHTHVDDRIVGGDNVRLGEYPWIAVLGYGGSNNREWLCGGALITSRYVVTAAHCSLRRFTGYDQIAAVRLGEHNLQTTRDCQTTDSSGPKCSDPVREFGVESTLRHPSFDQREQVSDDIALIRLDQNVQFTAWIHPVCLPSNGLNVESLVRRAGRTIVSGWGITDNERISDILQKVVVPFVDKRTCDSKWPAVNILPEQICFGGVAGKDSCNGDSGGPLIHPTTGKNPPYTLIGLVSYGARRCGEAGTPAVYTNVASYRTWILQNMKA